MIRLLSFPSRRLGRWGLLAVIGAVMVGGGCTRKDERVFTVRGVVRAPYADGTLSIQHEEIPGFMPAMTMPFYVAEAEARDLRPGDRVEFEFRVGEKSRAAKFRKLGTMPLAAAGLDSSRGSESLVRRLREGDPVPPFALIDQDEKPVSADDLKGRHTVISFVFTRCPVPEFCPLIAKKLQALQRQLGATRPAGERVQLLTITIDPEYDRPGVLRAYGGSLNADFSRWRFATGSTEEVERLAKLFAVRLERNGGSLDHTLATALIAPDGRVVEVWRGNAWQPDEIVARISAGAAEPTVTGRP